MGNVIQNISLYGKELFMDCPYGTVHSVYKRAVNLSVQNKLLSLQPKDSPMSPISLITNLSEEMFSKLEIKEKDTYFITKDTIIIKSGMSDVRECSFMYCEASAMDLKLSGQLTSSRIRSLKDCLSSILLSDSTEGLRRVLFSPNEVVTCPIDETTDRWIRETQKAVKKGEWMKGANCLSHLLGLGIGLTPSGDDFLCGVLAGLELGGKGLHPFAVSLRHRIVLDLSRTNDISREFLQCAVENQFALAVHSFYSDSGNVIFNKMKQIGHSSGIDTLCGILFAFGIWEI